MQTRQIDSTMRLQRRLRRSLTVLQTKTLKNRPPLHCRSQRNTRHHSCPEEHACLFRIRYSQWVFSDCNNIPSSGVKHLETRLCCPQKYQTFNRQLKWYRSNPECYKAFTFNCRMYNVRNTNPFKSVSCQLKDRYKISLPTGCQVTSSRLSTGHK